MDLAVIDRETLAEVEALLGRDGRDRLLRLAIEHARTGAAAIDAAADTATVRREAHALRGAVASIGAQVLAAVLAEIERDGHTTPALAPVVDATVSAARAALDG